MAYVTLAQMTARYGVEIDQLIDRDADGLADSGVFDDAATGADAEINGYLRTVYTLPFATTPPEITEIAYLITHYKLWGTRAPEQVRTRYEDAIQRLRDIVAGLITLDVGEQDSLPISYTSRERTFTDDTLIDYVGD